LTTPAPGSPDHGYLCRSGTLRPVVNHLKFDALARRQIPVSLGDNIGEMCKRLFAILTDDEAKPLGIVKPLNGSLFQKSAPDSID
jgi:hypothetical protein